MNKKITFIVTTLVLSSIIKWNLNNNNNTPISDLAKSNIEALAWDEADPDGGAPAACYKYVVFPKPENAPEIYVNVRYCGNCQIEAVTYWAYNGTCIL